MAWVVGEEEEKEEKERKQNEQSQPKLPNLLLSFIYSLGFFFGVAKITAAGFSPNSFRSNNQKLGACGGQANEQEQESVRIKEKKRKNRAE